MPFTLSANVDLLYTEAGDGIPDRIAAAAADGFAAVELWTTADRDLAAIRRAADDHGVAITSMLAEPRTNLMLPGTDPEQFFAGIAQSVDRARAIGCSRIVVSGGTGFMGIKRPQQLEKLAGVFTEMIARTEGADVGFILEPLNVRVDHPGALLDRTRDAVQVAEAVASPRFGVLYDLYHSITEGEDPAAEYAAAGGLVHYLQVADVPGRGEPGSGTVDWSGVLRPIAELGYSGVIGLEFFPTRPTTTAVEHIRTVAAAL